MGLNPLVSWSPGTTASLSLPLPGAQGVRQKGTALHSSCHLIETGQKGACLTSPTSVGLGESWLLRWGWYPIFFFFVAMKSHRWGWS